MLNDSAAALPFACAVDPTTGNLALTDINGQSNIGGVLVYAKAQGTPHVYSDPTLVVAYFCAYDASGNLFVDGLDQNYAFVLLELPVGSTTFETITVGGTIEFPGGIAWDGQYLAVGDQAYDGGRTSAIDDLSLSGTTATIVATIPLKKSCDVMQFALDWRNGGRRTGRLSRQTIRLPVSRRGRSPQAGRYVAISGRGSRQPRSIAPHALGIERAGESYDRGCRNQRPGRRSA